jgi:signal transduction histidine kinase
VSDPIFRAVLILVAQLVIALVIALILAFFGRLHKAKFLKSWSASASLFCASTLLIALLTARYFEEAGSRTVASMASLLAHNLHIFFLLLGAYEATTGSTLRRGAFRLFVGAACLLALVPLFSAFDPDGERLRYALRIGIREVLTTCGFIAASLMLLLVGKLPPIGSRLVALSLFLFGAAHSYYIYVVVRNLRGYPEQLPSFFGVAETVLISTIGFGLVIWLLEDERRRLQKANQQMDSFLYSTSHDLRAPIASVLGITNLARLEISDPKSLEYLGMIEERIKKLDMVISDILQLSRSANTETRYEEINFSKLLEEVVAEVQYNAGASAISLRYQPPASVVFFGDYTQMKIVLGNLFANAVKYHRLDQPDPYIEVRFGKSDRQVLIEVEDNGEGILPEHQQKIFDMFYRASTRADGTGLGLYIVKEALSRVNGSILVSSRPGAGSTFRVMIPQR